MPTTAASDQPSQVSARHVRYARALRGGEHCLARWYAVVRTEYDAPVARRNLLPLLHLTGWMMTELTLVADIGCPAEKIFDLITDFGGQDRWLAPSSSFRGTTVLTPGPVGLGTRYRESDPFGVRNGTVTGFERPAAVTFHQPMTIRLHAGTIDVTVCYTLTPAAGSTRVTRVVTLGIPWPLKLFQPVLIGAFKKESRRTLLALKAYADQ